MIPLRFLSSDAETIVRLPIVNSNLSSGTVTRNLHSKSCASNLGKPGTATCDAIRLELGARLARPLCPATGAVDDILRESSHRPTPILTDQSACVFGCLVQQELLVGREKFER